MTGPDLVPVRGYTVQPYMRARRGTRPAPPPPPPVPVPTFRELVKIFFHRK